jgi:hypothetical protein
VIQPGSQTESNANRRLDIDEDSAMVVWKFVDLVVSDAGIGGCARAE